MEEHPIATLPEGLLTAVLHVAVCAPRRRHLLCVCKAWTACLPDAPAHLLLHRFGRYAVVDASMHGKTEVVACLLRLRRDEPATADSGMFVFDSLALRHAAVRGHVEIVRLLLAAGSRARASGAHVVDREALRLAARKGHVEVECLLLGAAAAPKHTERCG